MSKFMGLPIVADGHRGRTLQTDDRRAVPCKRTNTIVSIQGCKVTVFSCVKHFFRNQKSLICPNRSQFREDL